MKIELEQIVAGCQRKDPKAQKRLYEVFAPKLLGLCMRYTTCRDEAQDLLHDGFIKIFESIGTLGNANTLEHWLHQIMTNTCIDYIRQNCQIQYSDLDTEEKYLLIADEDDNETASPYPNFTMEQIVSAIQSLPAQQRAVFNLCGVEEIKYRQAAQMLGLTESNIRQQLKRAKDQLRKKLNNRIKTI